MLGYKLYKVFISKTFTLVMLAIRMTLVNRNLIASGFNTASLITQLMIGTFYQCSYSLFSDFLSIIELFGFSCSVKEQSTKEFNTCFFHEAGIRACFSFVCLFVCLFVFWLVVVVFTL